MEKDNLILAVQHMQTSFLNEFNREWNVFLTKCDSDLSEAQQLHIGNHMRPQLVCWGFMINKDMVTYRDFSSVAKLTVSIEAVHKASIIIDDIIDSDTKRRGTAAMHQVYGEYQTVLFAVCMLAKGISQIREGIPTSHASIYGEIVDVLCNTVHSMCLGAIAEISAPIEKQIDLSFVQKIIDCETAQLIRNSLYMGFLSSNEANAATGDILSTIGLKCGYIFQVMNDLEPFCNPKYITEYKGDINADFIRSRKSIVLPHLYHACTSHDRESLLTAIHENSVYKVLSLFEKYSIHEKIAEEIERIYTSICHLLDNLKKIGYLDWASSFEMFTESLQKKYRSILYP